MKRRELDSGASEFEIKVYRDRLPAKVLSEIALLDKAVFKKPLSRAVLQRELEAKSRLLALVAYSKGKPCGFKMGYEQSARRFYSWLGGVHPDFRSKGLARDLMKRQHELVKATGYKFVVTHTRNDFKEMLILNIRSGFSIVGVKQNLGEREVSIVMEKKI